jgi:hypothetical protein
MTNWYFKLCLFIFQPKISFQCLFTVTYWAKIDMCLCIKLTKVQNTIYFLISDLPYIEALYNLSSSLHDYIRVKGKNLVTNFGGYLTINWMTDYISHTFWRKPIKILSKHRMGWAAHLNKNIWKIVIMALLLLLIHNTVESDSLRVKINIKYSWL